MRAAAGSVPDSWSERLPRLFKPYLWHELSEPHEALWSWAEGIDSPEAAVRPFIALWPRNRGKSTHAEILVADLAARKKRIYCLYVSETQEQADKHIQTIQMMLMSRPFSIYFPEMGRANVGKYGKQTWRRSLMRTGHGVTAEAIGLDRAIRGQKIDWARPDLIILDDIDAKHDTEYETNRKLEVLTTSVLPAGASNVAVLFVQNLIHRNSIAMRLSRQPGQPGAADFLATRIISGPHKAVEGLEYSHVELPDGSLRWKITGGRSLWNGFDLRICEDEINRVGPSAFDLESQHEVDVDEPLALLSSADIDATRVYAHPELSELVVCVDPEGGAGQTGIIAVGKAKVGRVEHGYTVADASTPRGASTTDWARAALRLYHNLDADAIVAEINFGGKMVEQVIKATTLRDEKGNILVDGADVSVIPVHASRGKQLRAQPVAALFKEGRAHHVGQFPALQRQWTRWVPGAGMPSPDRLDAEVWGYTHLLLGQAQKKPVYAAPIIHDADDVLADRDEDW